MTTLRDQAIEAAARAIWANTEAGIYGIEFHERTAAGESLITMATAAFYAILGVIGEPSEEMLAMGDDVLGEAYELVSPETVYQAMIRKLGDRK